MTITEEQKALIKAAFGKQYTEKAINHLNAAEIFNDRSEPYTAAALKMIVNGFNENERVVTALVTQSIAILDGQNDLAKVAKRKSKQLLK